VTNFRFGAACAEAGVISGPNRACIPSQAVFGNKGMKMKQAEPSGLRRSGVQAIRISGEKQLSGRLSLICEGRGEVRIGDV
jgi:hypothetical protein